MSYKTWTYIVEVIKRRSASIYRSKEGLEMWTLAVLLEEKRFDCLQSPSQGCGQGGAISGQKLVLGGVIGLIRRLVYYSTYN